MIFLRFDSQEQRRTFGGTEFIEFQYCRLPRDTALTELFSIDRIDYWKDDSLYVHGDNTNIFYQEYKDILGGGIHPDVLEHIEAQSFLDLYGINYYDPALIESLMEQLRTHRPTDYEPLIEWLHEAGKYHGFYIFGF